MRPPNTASDTATDAAIAIETRLTELEIKASYTEDLLEELNLVIYRQQQQIDRLVVHVQQLREQVPEGRGAGAGSGSGGFEAADSRHELPPHY